jgi:hypothetical protein
MDDFGHHGPNAGWQGSEVLLWCSGQIVCCLHGEGGITSGSSIGKLVLDLHLSGHHLVSRLVSFLLGYAKCGARGLKLITQLFGIQTGP